MVFRFIKIVFCFIEIAIRFNEIVFRFNEIAIRFNEIVFRFIEIAIRFNEIVFCFIKIAIRFNKIVFRFFEIIFRFIEIKNVYRMTPTGLRTFASDNLNIAKMIISALHRVENIVEQEGQGGPGSLT